MKGYKGVVVKYLTLEDKNSQVIFEPGIRYTLPKLDHDINDFNDCYFHFCKTPEDVLIWGFDYIRTSIEMAKYPSMASHGESYRLFEIYARDDCFSYADHYVTNDFTLIRELPPEEIYTYFMKSEKAFSAMCTAEGLSSSKGRELLDNYHKAGIRTIHSMLDDESMVENYFTQLYRGLKPSKKIESFRKIFYSCKPMNLMEDEIYVRYAYIQCCRNIRNGKNFNRDYEKLNSMGGIAKRYCLLICAMKSQGLYSI